MAVPGNPLSECIFDSTVDLKCMNFLVFYRFTGGHVVYTGQLQYHRPRTQNVVLHFTGR